MSPSTLLDGGAPVPLPANQPADRFYRGGSRIAAFRQVPPDGDHVPEDWVASATTLAGEDRLGLTVLPDGQTLREAVAADPERWLGPGHAADPALLVKLLDAGERLPVHVHPDDAFAREHLSCPRGKTEAWIVLDCEPDARVHLGFRHEVGPEQLSHWVREQARDAMLSALHELPVQTGDTVYVPAGLPHAIGAGGLLLELQQASDLSLLLEHAGYAVDGPRDGHLGIGFEAALACVRHTAVSAAELGRLRGRWDDAHVFPHQADHFFRVERLAAHELDADLEPGFSVLVVVEGAGRLTWGGPDGGKLGVRAGATVAVPHGAGRVRLQGALHVLRCRPPG